MRNLSAESVVITGLGLCSSLGNVVTACAAARAGLSAGADLNDFLVQDEDGAEERPLGHPVRRAGGFQGLAKLVCLAWPALDDLLQNNDVRGSPPERTDLHVCLPEPDQRRIEDEEAPVARPRRRPRGAALCERLVRLGQLQIPRDHWHPREGGPTAVLRALSDASAKLRSGERHRCLVGAVDSLLEASTLDWAHQNGRLRAPGKPDGLAPGEAAAFLLLERYDAARARSAEVLAVLAGVSLATEADGGAALAAAVAKLLPHADPAKRTDAWLVSDHNGEHRRASELGAFLARLSHRHPSLSAGARWFPAMSFGDTGTAAPLLAACMSARSFTRGYAPLSSAVVLASSDGPERGALRLDHPTRSGD